ncbi:MAG: shikimate kinase [Candidatus Hinthialibacter sp.]
MNLVFIGYRGTGKTALSHELSARLGMPVFHMDEILEERFGEKISEFVQKCGWPAFRDAEAALAEELSQKEGVIIDCGGGVVTRQTNMDHLRRKGFIVWLQADLFTIRKRIGDDGNRPSLTGKKSSTDEITEVLNQRIPLYESAADMEIDTSTHPFPECVNQIMLAWRDHLETMETS